ncbi:GLC8 Protein GLC8 [Candida maltosa Xu316]
MPDHHPKGILRNRPDGYDEEHHEVPDRLDRNEVIKNTKLNAQLASESSKGEEIRAKIAEKKKQHEIDPNAPDHLKWDEINLYKNEQEKTATMKIDEPKTPYEGGFNPEGEYYRDDDEDQEGGPGDIVGEGEFDKTSHASGSLHGGQVIRDENQDEEEEEEEEPEEEPLTAEERHRRFEEKRKQHYHLKGLPLKTHIDVPDTE